MENNDERLKLIETEQTEIVNLIKVLSEEIKRPKPPFPRITLKKSSLKSSRVGWEISSSSSEDKEELLEIAKMIKEVNGDMETKFEKEGVEE